ncbi:skin secretory protein xP2-like [Myotis myotis]|uniref:skin secretory protein xP2-like n=1 Tax=Myotis myotis TaxID=51298 RepID=UPI00174ACFA9|nr:skin secretory protein xP2-like [Myotis myotis]
MGMEPGVEELAAGGPGPPRAPTGKALGQTDGSSPFASSQASAAATKHRVVPQSPPGGGRDVIVQMEKLRLREGTSLPKVTEVSQERRLCAPSRTARPGPSPLSGRHPAPCRPWAGSCPVRLRDSEPRHQLRLGSTDGRIGSPAASKRAAPARPQAEAGPSRASGPRCDWPQGDGKVAISATLGELSVLTSRGSRRAQGPRREEPGPARLRAGRESGSRENAGPSELPPRADPPQGGGHPASQEHEGASRRTEEGRPVVFVGPAAPAPASRETGRLCAPRGGTDPEPRQREAGRVPQAPVPEGGLSSPACPGP